MSRLDRLILILDNGSSSTIRATAAEQIGTITKDHPNELKNLLKRVSKHLKSPTWETRIAAGKAIMHICKNTKEWTPINSTEETKNEEYSSEEDKKILNDYLTFQLFDLEKIMMNGKKLLGSAGKEYDCEFDHYDSKKKLDVLRNSIKLRLGLGSQFIEDDILGEDDILNNQVEKVPDKPQKDHNSTEIEEKIVDLSKLSARERNMLKRKAKRTAKENKAKDRKVADSLSFDSTKRKPEKEQHKETKSIKLENKVIEEDDHNVSSTSDYNAWPFKDFCDALLIDLFHPSWEHRHGASIGLREVLKSHGKCAGMRNNKTKRENEKYHRIWLQDVCLKLVCIFALDRFCDFISDQVVAPVRESCSQTLGTAAKHLNNEDSTTLQKILLRLVFQDFALIKTSIWEARHAGLLALKYFIAVRQDIVNLFIEDTIEAVMLGLCDTDDDVRAVSAATLIPIVDKIITHTPHKLEKILCMLWDCLMNTQDDLSSSTANIMDLIAKFVTHRETIETMIRVSITNTKMRFSNILQVLYPFFRHPIETVRSAVVSMLKQLILCESISKEWIDLKFLALVLQNIILEQRESVSADSILLWNTLFESTDICANKCNVFIDQTTAFLIEALIQVMTPIGAPINMGFLEKYIANMIQSNSEFVREHNIDSGMISQDLSFLTFEEILRCKTNAISALSLLFSRFYEQRMGRTVVEYVVLPALNSKHCMQRFLCNVFLQEFISNSKNVIQLDLIQCEFKNVIDYLKNEITNNTHSKSHYIEESYSLNTLKIEYINFLGFLKKRNELLGYQLEDLVETSLDDFSSRSAEDIVEPKDTNTKSYMLQTFMKGLTDEDQKLYHAYFNKLKICLDQYRSLKKLCHVQVNSSNSCTLVMFGFTTQNASDLVLPLIESIKIDPIVDLQRRSAATISALLTTPSYNLSDSTITEILQSILILAKESNEYDYRYFNEEKDVILSIKIEDSKKGKKPEPLNQISGPSNAVEFVIQFICKDCGPLLFEKLPGLYEMTILSTINLLSGGVEQQEKTQEINKKMLKDSRYGQLVLDNLKMYRLFIKHISPLIHFRIDSLIDCFFYGLFCENCLMRYAIADCLAETGKYMLTPTIKKLITHVLPKINHNDKYYRLGSVETIYLIVSKLSHSILPYIIFFVVPILGRMSDSEDKVRACASHCFALLVNLIPLEENIPDPLDFSVELSNQKAEERQFLDQLLNISKLQNYEIPVKINATLRSYQQEGVNWLNFLNKYNLNGILCDDMGLGKTLQTICMLASSHSPERKDILNPSIVICPSTLTAHWYHEIIKYCDNLTPVVYYGGPNERRKCREKIFENYHRNGKFAFNVIITSYDVIRNDVQYFNAVHWNYCVLDEGHIIKNSKTKLTKAVKTLKSMHRLILSGTPIQNNVLELWSLFDFLMCGYLGDERLFNDKYSKPILNSRDSKSSSSEKEKGQAALDQLHKQVLPFLLRRLKEEVLDDLPPKIIQDLYCELTPTQKYLYDSYISKQSDSTSSDSNKNNVFQSLQFLRKVCNHPKLVADHANILKDATLKLDNMNDISVSPKLLCLKQLLNECGIGTSTCEESNEKNLHISATVSQHRALIFCQLKVMVDIVENDLLKKELPQVSYMRLDSQLDVMKRHEMVEAFNNDPSIDVLLLTTNVGGLGLNLTGADTVIFVEHDWNPMKDLQAMDRAHRLGQKKVVNVYRLIAKNTIEEKIMGLQKFKLNIANTIVSQQNSSLSSMQTSNLLDMFNSNMEASKDKPNPKKKNMGLKDLLDNLDDLWDPEAYTEEFNFDNFVSGL